MGELVMPYPDFKGTDGLLMHLYSHGPRSVTEDLPFGPRNALQLVAAADMCSTGLVNTIYLSGKYKAGGESVPLSLRVKDALLSMDVGADVIAVPQGQSSVDEVTLFSKKAREKGWKSLSGVGTADHTRRLARVYAKEATVVNLYAAEHVVTHHLPSHPKAEDLLDYFADLRNTWLFKFKEFGLHVAYSSGLDPLIQLVAGSRLARAFQEIIDK